MENRFYVYGLLNPLKSGTFNYGNLSFDFKPFYIGKGCGNRCKEHLKSKYSGETSHKQNIINKIFSQNELPVIIKIKTGLTSNEAFLLEKEIIQKIGISNLSNVCEGGIGRDSDSMRGEKNPIFGTKRPKWIIDKMQEARKKTNTSDKKGKKLEEILGEDKAQSAKKKMSTARKGKTWEEYYGEDKAMEIRENRKKNGHKPHSEETKRKIKEKICTPELIEKRRKITIEIREAKFKETFDRLSSVVSEMLSFGNKLNYIQEELSISRYILKKIIKKNNELRSS